MKDLEIHARPLTARSEQGDEWIVSELHSSEQLDDLFQHRAVILARKLSETALLGQQITFCYQPGRGSDRVRQRYFHGYCVQVRQVGLMASRGYLHYELLVSPWCWFLQQRTNCRIFQQKKTGDIITSICREHDFQSDLQLKTNNDSRLEYCVQFNESDWDFICRLIAARGWFYYFRQDNGRHQLVVGETNRVFSDCGESDIEYFVDSTRLERAITRWVHGYWMVAGSVQSADYNMTTGWPILTDEVKSQQSMPHRRRLQQYFYPGAFASREQGGAVVEKRQEALDTRLSEVEGESTLTGFAAGTTFALKHHPDSQEQQHYLLRLVNHVMVTAEDGRSLEYSNGFSCIPLKTPWQTRQAVTKPPMPGLHSATVVGPEKDEVYLDEFHRIKVQFHWDREGQANQNSSCWIRVAQVLAGDGFGCQFTPRVGDEVLVSFLDHDPDRPVVVGTVYNGQRRQPYKSGMEQGIKLKSLPKGGADNFSELRFNCHKGEELMYVQAEKDRSILIKNDNSRVIKGKDTTLVEKTSERTVKENDSHKIEGEQLTEVTGNITTRTRADCMLDTAGNYQQKTDGSYSLEVRGATDTRSTGDVNITSKGSISESATGSLDMDAGNISATGKTAIKLSVGASSISLSGSSVQIKCGPSTVTLSPSGVEISGVQVNIDGKVSATVKGGVSAAVEGVVNAELKGTLVNIKGNGMTAVKAGAMVDLSGAIVKIN
ncbi:MULTISPECIES: type VI secretion system Vgr family protein [unclassified Endozoicomonas]|uniref:type VI secretion system Vgr family protein n=1 Tax=unclassified Endozoicomonas TaxID=2644528 RepID=UPI003BB6BEBA